MAKRPPVVAGVAPVVVSAPSPIAHPPNPRPAITGGFAAPAGAPYEIAQPLQPDAGGIVDASGVVHTPAALAARNERSLQPLTYAKADQVTEAPGGDGYIPAVPISPRPAQPRGVQPAPQVQPAANAKNLAPRAVADASSAHVPIAPRPVLAAGGVGAQLAAAVKLGQAASSSTPAASNTDSPSRGIPRASTDPGKTITGGFGDAGAAEYFALDGSEVLKVIWVVMDELAKRATNDLRFSPAIVYPRVAVRVDITVEGYADDQTFSIERAAVPNDRTPLELARALSDEVIFVVRAERREFDRAGQSDTPANAMRAEIGSVAPRKQVVGTGHNRQIVDVVS